MRRLSIPGFELKFIDVPSNSYRTTKEGSSSSVSYGGGILKLFNWVKFDDISADHFEAGMNLNKAMHHRVLSAQSS